MGSAFSSSQKKKSSNTPADADGGTAADTGDGTIAAGDDKRNQYDDSHVSAEPTSVFKNVSKISLPSSKSTPTPAPAPTPASPIRPGTRRPSIKVSLTEEELKEAHATFSYKNPSAAAASEPPVVDLLLMPHEHSLFCERKERVCQSIGKLQEHERVAAAVADGVTYDPASLVWLRSVAGQGQGQGGLPEQFEEIAGSLGALQYELTAEDVGRYIKLAGRRAAASEAEGEAGASASASASAAAATFESAAVLGPVLPGPPRLLSITVVESNVGCRVGTMLCAATDYIGGKEGASEFWWMRIRSGERENISEPAALTAEQQAVSGSSLPTLGASVVAGDPRVYELQAGDVGCVFKVKCRPVRCDGYRGEVFTSKQSKAAEL